MTSSPTVYRVFAMTTCKTTKASKLIAESVELIATFLATQEMVEYVAPTTEWVAAEVDIDVDVAQEQLQRIPVGPQNLTAETFELIQRAHNYVVGHLYSAHWISYTDKASALKVCKRW
jgi:hypothetical protein